MLWWYSKFQMAQLKHKWQYWHSCIAESLWKTSNSVLPGQKAGRSEWVGTVQEIMNKNFLFSVAPSQEWSDSSGYYPVGCGQLQKIPSTQNFTGFQNQNVFQDILSNFGFCTPPRPPPNIHTHTHTQNEIMADLAWYKFGPPPPTPSCSRHTWFSADLSWYIFGPLHLLT